MAASGRGAPQRHDVWYLALQKRGAATSMSIGPEDNRRPCRAPQLMEAPVPPISPRNSRFVTTNQRNAQPASELFDATIRHASGQIPVTRVRARRAPLPRPHVGTKVTAAAVEDPRAAATGSPRRPRRARRCARRAPTCRVTAGSPRAPSSNTARRARRAGRRARGGPRGRARRPQPRRRGPAARPLTSDEGHVPGYSASCRATTSVRDDLRREDARRPRTRRAPRATRADARGLPRDGTCPAIRATSGLAATTRQLVHRPRASAAVPTPITVASGVDHRLLRPECAAARRPARPCLCRPRCVCSRGIVPVFPSARSVGSARPPALQAA